MPTYRRKPLSVNATQIMPSMGAHDWARMPDWLTAAYERGDVLFGYEGVRVSTPSGWVQTQVGDWLVQDPKGSISPCCNAVFLEEYEEVGA